MAKLQFDPTRYPAAPGCYLMRDAAGRVLYVGKAVNLRRRLGSYFRRRGRGRRTARLMARVAQIDVILAGSEQESLILENNLIKHHKPPFNRKLIHEDTGYHYIALTDEPYPRLVPYRKHRMNKPLRGQPVRQRLGPYLSYRFRNALLEYVADAFRLRTCETLGQQVCLRYHMGRCGGVCEGRVPTAQYAQAIEQAVAFLSSPHHDLVRQMRERMADHAARLEFEQAGRIRDQIEVLEHTLEAQVVERDVPHDQDVVYLGECQVLIAHLRQGAIYDLATFDLQAGLGYDEACERFLLGHYARDCPQELIVNRLARPQHVARVLCETHGRQVEVTVPRQGVQCDLIALCRRNYEYRISIAAGG